MPVKSKDCVLTILFFMSPFFLLLQSVHSRVHVLPMKLNYNEPKIFTGGVDIAKWNKLKKSEQKLALSKDWYLYYSFRNPVTGILVRQVNIKAGVNFYKDKETRYHLLKIMKESLLIVLEEGFNPYNDNKELSEYLLEKLNRKDTQETSKPIAVQKVQNSIQEVEKETKQEIIPAVAVKPVISESIIDENALSIDEAFKLALSIKINVMNATSYLRYKSRIARFNKWLLIDLKGSDLITCITKKRVIQYLNDVLQKTSPRNRNNTRTDLSSFFQTLEDNEVIKENFIKKINVLKAVPERNKTYTPKQQEEVFDYLKENEPTLFLFVQFIAYNLLRPIEVCRLRIKDIDIEDKKLYVKAKNQPVKIKIIPDILLKEIPNLNKFKKEDFLFSGASIGGAWEIGETDKRSYYTKRFKKVKDHFGLDKNYGLYSFRHTFITKLYREMAKTASPFEVKSKLQLITGHATMGALEQYLRDIDAALPEDYSKLIDTK